MTRNIETISFETRSLTVRVEECMLTLNNPELPTREVIAMRIIPIQVNPDKHEIRNKLIKKSEIPDFNFREECCREKPWTIQFSR